MPHLHADLRWLTLAVLLLVAGPMQCTTPSDQGATGPHVIFISMDTARADHFGFMDSETVRTPHLDALAAESIVLTDFATVVPTTLASHTSLFTGKHPHHHGTPRNGFMVNPQNEMLPEILKRAGYGTAGFIGSFALESRFDFNQGFDHYDETFEQLVGQGGADQNQRSARSVTDAVLEYLDGVSSWSPQFLFVHYFDPHGPYTPPPPFDTAYDPRGRAGLSGAHRVEIKPPIVRQNMPACAKRHELQYAGEISYMDEQIGRLLNGVEQRGFLANAVVVITSDHGENLWEHETPFDHGYGVYESTMNGVCLIRLPGAAHGPARIDAPACSVDVLPTVLKVLDLEAPAGIDGQSIPLDQSPQPRAIYGQATKPWEAVETDPRWTNMRSSRDTSRKVATS